MKILIDTNIFIPLEVTDTTDIEASKMEIDFFYSCCVKSGFSVYLHKEIYYDINRDTNTNRKHLRLLATQKYPQLEDVKYNDDVKQKIGLPPQDSHDYVDNHLLNALYCNAVNILVTNDIAMHKKARLLEIVDKVYSLNDALKLFENLHGQLINIPPQVESEKCYNIILSDPIFHTLRQDYPEFDSWFVEKCQKEHRSCFVTRKDNFLSGIVIFKEESPCYHMSGKILKICTFKTAENAAGNKLGEVLLRSVFDYCYQNAFDWIYTTAYEENYICTFFENFGFRQSDLKKENTGEIIFRKQLKPTDLGRLSHLQYHILYGPRYAHPAANYFLIPIMPIYHERLFPELEEQLSLFPRNDSFSNGILKAYLSKSKITLLKEGDLIFFYRSHDYKCIQARGVIEKVCRALSIDELIALTGKRTAYTIEELKENYITKETLVILFRQATSLPRKIKPADVQIESIPQSIVQLTDRVKKCLQQATM